MTHLNKYRITTFLKWVSSDFVDSYRKTSFFYIASNYNTRFYRRKANEIEKADFFSHDNWKEAQSALLEYLHYTRNLLFSDAEKMSRNSSYFLEKLIRKVGAKEDVGKSIAHLLRYSPINEFEPFYESVGLKPYEYSVILQRDLMFLCDDELLMENYKLLCNYGIERKNLGKFFKETPEVFRYECGVLALKLEAYERTGLSRSFVAKMVVCSPYLLIGNVNEDLLEVLQILKKGGIEMSWIEDHLSERSSYNWRRLLAVLHLFRMRGYNEEMLGYLISMHPGILFEDSGKWTLLLIGFLAKFGCNNDQISSVFQGFPKIHIPIFVSNMRRSFQILSKMEMVGYEIGKIMCSHPLLLGSYKFLQTTTMCRRLHVDMKRLCKLIQENPQILKNLVIQSRSKCAYLPGGKAESERLKTKFFTELGFADTPNLMEETLRLFKGSGAELQDRFNCLVEAGFDKKDICEMVKVAPDILAISKNVIKRKIDFLVNDLHCPMSSIVTFPSCFFYRSERAKLRLTMYNWLKDQGTCNFDHTLSSLLVCGEKRFLQQLVHCHPKGLEVWEDLKRKIYSESGR